MFIHAQFSAPIVPGVEAKASRRWQQSSFSRVRLQVCPHDAVRSASIAPSSSSRPGRHRKKESNRQSAPHTCIYFFLIMRPSKVEEKAVKRTEYDNTEVERPHAIQGVKSQWSQRIRCQNAEPYVSARHLPAAASTALSEMAGHDRRYATAKALLMLNACLFFRHAEKGLERYGRPRTAAQRSFSV